MDLCGVDLQIYVHIPDLCSLKISRAGNGCTTIAFIDLATTKAAALILYMQACATSCFLSRLGYWSIVLSGREILLHLTSQSLSPNKVFITQVHTMSLAATTAHLQCSLPPRAVQLAVSMNPLVLPRPSSLPRTSPGSVQKQNSS